ncbi:MAG: serine/threonine-protein kinase [Planctomycetota bacterium]
MATENHLDDWELREIARGTLVTSKSELAAAHLRQCSFCRDRLERFRREERSTDTAIVPNLRHKDLVALARDAIERSGQFGPPKLIASGGQALIYKAFANRYGRDVAIKCVPKMFNDKSSIEDHMAIRMRREFAITRGLDHARVLSALEFIEHWDGCFALVSEFSPGTSLRRFVELHGPLNPLFALQVLQQSTDAMIAYSGWNIVHRDLSPNNILVQAAGDEIRLVLIDFGIAKSPSASEDHSITVGALGTPGFISPEQGRHADKVGIASDVYSLGRTVGYALHAENSRRRYAMEYVGLPSSCPKPLRQLLQVMTLDDEKRRPNLLQIEERISTMQSANEGLRIGRRNLLVAGVGSAALGTAAFFAYRNKRSITVPTYSVAFPPVGSEPPQKIRITSNRLSKVDDAWFDLEFSCRLRGEDSILRVEVFEEGNPVSYAIEVNGRPGRASSITRRAATEFEVVNSAAEVIAFDRQVLMLLSLKDGFIGLSVEGELFLACRQLPELTGEVTIVFSGNNADALFPNEFFF